MGGDEPGARRVCLAWTLAVAKPWALSILASYKNISTHLQAEVCWAACHCRSGFGNLEAEINDLTKLCFTLPPQGVHRPHCGLHGLQNGEDLRAAAGARGHRFVRGPGSPGGGWWPVWVRARLTGRELAPGPLALGFEIKWMWAAGCLIIKQAKCAGDL